MIKYLVFLFSTVAVAAEPTVEITSFNYVASKGRAAEICGKVSGAATYPVYVNVTVDPKYDRPGNYSVVALGEKFCTVVVSYTGTAEAAIAK